MTRQSLFPPDDSPKRCSMCGAVKPAGDFHRNPHMRDGRKSWCKPCDRVRCEQVALADMARVADGSVTSLRCTGCRQTKPLDDFHLYKRGRYGRNGLCKVCMSAKTIRIRSELRKDPAWRQKARRSHRRYNLRHSYGLTHEEYDAMHAAQGGLCAICGRPETARRHGHIGQTRDLGVDHDHATGAIRSLLCGHCNHILGHARDEISILEAAIRYLRRHGK